MTGFAVNGEGSDQVLVPSSHANLDHTSAPLNLLNQTVHNTLDHSSVPGVMDPAEHAATDHTGLPGVPAAEAFTAGVHAGTNHAGLPGVPGAETFTAGVHAGTSHAGIAGIPAQYNYTGILDYGSDWGGGSQIYLQANEGRTAGGITSGTDARTRVYMPFSGWLMAVSWTALNEGTSRQAQVLINGGVASGFTFTLNSLHRITPTPVAFGAGSYIQVAGNIGVGSGDPNGVLVQVYIRSP